jgi:misacylated tRNA(Ala) deacylase
MTQRLYWEDDHCTEANAIVVQVRENAFAFDQTCFYPGGGGQPHDTGVVILQDGSEIKILSVHSDESDTIWHSHLGGVSAQIARQPVRLLVDRDRRIALARYHTVLHVLNTIALRDYNGWITGVQIAVDYSRIDFKLDGIVTRIRSELEERVNSVLAQGGILKSYYVPEAEFRQRADLLRTLEVNPPVIDGRVRVVEIEGFDAQACGGTHVTNLSELGRFSISKTENKGKNNKRLYVKLS